MAIVFNPPHVQAQEARQRDLDSRLNSADPLTRYRAGEELYCNQIAQMGRQMAAQAEKSARAYQAEIRRCEESDRMNNKYAPLPKGAKVTK